ncbi:response regulator [Peteryoungia ipomoeae]|uniref:Response regulator n=1 Tax=Peteryoungia ipomoeae TaxID=1210932 RepID=A0A4S8NT23_9HYPH|nr:response regulator [Peteryoungia ipomoeae]THV20583.1 response regulator [Peteryoungia ipomoeae]
MLARDPNHVLADKAAQPASAGRVLIVDDDRMGLTVLSSMVEELGYRVETAVNGAEAYAMLREDPGRADLVVTDRMMPVMDGLALTRRLKRDPETAGIPVVMLTGATETSDIAAGLEAGAFYYLVKPAAEELVTSVLNSAMQDVRRRESFNAQVGAHQSAFANVRILRMVLTTPREVEPVCSLLASVHPQPDKVVQGIFELVQNAIEHGLLRFGLQEKQRLVGLGKWQDALAERSLDPAYRGEVEATIVRKDEALVLTVKDPGPGFAWRNHLTVDPSRSSAACGRGVARANTLIFDRLVYNEAGNEATALMRLQQRAKW